MNSIRRGKWLALAAGALLLAALPLAGQEGEEERGFTFTVSPIAIGVMESDVDTDSGKWEEYRDLSSGFTIPILRIEGNGGGDRYLDFRAENIRYDDARYTLGYGVTGRYSLLVDYNKIPHNFGPGHMIFTRTGPGRYEIADPVQASIQGALENQFTANRGGVNFPFLNNLLAPYLAVAQEVELGLQRNRSLVRTTYGGLTGFSWALEYRHENRDGDRPFGASFGFSNATEIPEPIAHDTTDAELAGEWSTERSAVRFGYRYSTFENSISTLVWDNPFRLVGSTDPTAYLSPGGASIGGSALGFSDLWPDNESNLVFLDGRAELGGNWFVQGSASYNRMTQDDPLLPYTLNTAITGINFDHSTFDATNPANLPTRNADNEVDVMNLAARTGTKFGDNIDLTFEYRLYDYDNSSRQIRFPGYVRYHAVWEEIPRISIPYSYTRQNLGAELGWRFGTSRLGLAYELENWDREFREVDETDEDILRLTFDSQPSPRFGVHASYELGDRSIDHYEVEAQEVTFLDPHGVNNQPGLRKFDEAVREYDELNLSMQFFATEAWSFFVGANLRIEDYDESQFGLLSDEITQYNAEISYAPGERLNFYAFGHIADRESFQRDRQSGGTLSTNPLDDWTADLEETTDTFGLGFNTKLSAWTTDISVRWSDTEGFADLFSPPGGTPDVAVDIENYDDVELLAILARVEYQLSRSAKAGLGYRWEDYTVERFLTQGLRNYLPGALLLNPNMGDYQGSVFLLDLSLFF